MLNKPKILFAPYGLLAHYLRCIELAKYLSDEFEIVFIFSEKYNAFVEDSGFAVSKPKSQGFSDVVNKAKDFDFTWLNKKAVKAEFEMLKQIIGDQKPDVIVGDTYPALRMAAEACSVKLIAVCNIYITDCYDGFRDVPNRHRANKYRKFFPEDKWLKLVRLIEKISLKNVHKAFREIRRENGLSKQSSLFDEFAGDFNLICDSDKVFKTKKNLPDKHLLIGPILYKCKKEENEITRQIKEHKKKVIFISTGSSGGNIFPDIINKNDLADFLVIVAGANQDKTDENVIYRKFVNFDKISSEIDLIICHGGNGSLYQALNAGKPVIAIPSNFEQEWNVSAFIEIGACSVYYKTEPKEKLISMIFSQLCDTKIKSNFLKSFEQLSDASINIVKDFIAGK